MPTPTFQRLSPEQFEQLLQNFPFTRKIDAVHMHHTWRPRHADFRGHDTIVSMWRFHTQVNGWSDIAQHITIDPEGMIWLGRNWNLPPASAAGHNGNKAFGPFMFEMIGDFDQGRDPFDGLQKDTALRVVALVQARFHLPAGSLRFHNAMSPKSCPGSALVYNDILAEVELLRQELQAAGTREPARQQPFPEETDRNIAEAIRSLSRITDNAGESGDAELSHDEREAGAAPAAGAGPAAPVQSRDSGLSTAALNALRPHLVNLKVGRLSGEGEASSTPEDIDAIFEQHLPQAVSELPAGQKLRLLFYAHGGLVSEASGLQIASKHIDWWRRNGVYPVYFIWETGFFETIGQLLGRAQQGSRAVSRGLADFTTDPLLEIGARVLQGPRIWGGMKSSAEHAVDPPSGSGDIGGGAHYVARQLKAFCDAHAGQVELHAVGHSAGSIFHSHFLPLAHGLGVPAFRTAHFLAPAVRVDTFRQHLLEHIGPGRAVESLTLYTMRRDFERQDNCAQIYRKSLLYLIFNALEDRRATAILGLEESLRGDADLKRLFGLGATPATPSSVVWSPTPGDTGRSASTSQSHGGFDDDAPTMNSVVRRVLDKPDAADIAGYPAARAASRPWIEEVDWPADFDFTAGAGYAAPPIKTQVPALPYMPPSPALLPAVPLAGNGNGGGRRLALCVGIDAYPAPEHQLAGCVNDARNWGRTLAGLGFETRLLLDGDASRATLERELSRLVDQSRCGDVIVFQYAGHGTQAPDLNGDEDDNIDEALCPVDFASGALYIDDDIAALFARIPDGVNMTCFMDCCHSGTNTRFAVGLSPGEMARPPGTKARFVKLTPAIIEAHKRFRQQLRGASRAISSGGAQRMRDVKFSACLDHQVALESEGSGDFTRRATKVLATGIQGMSNEEFLRRVLAEFGGAARQAPMLDCADDARTGALLQPLAAGSRAPASREPATTSGPPGDAALLQAVNGLAKAVQALAAR
ncbi:caspase family protein [Polaromonas naphthalenivorans]|uniref:Peptidase C14, caspase catalytic subunit p20 n=1 Tax=Polaromonas naphthalenivorans (strain CJ2) TaxID=365044 RepID=A1VLJ0_POLNA|nr:caspase family protein [Polaromonas naphthalenivorans]ABM36518.1 peptidase C14, caspase catalytic subunit p20 [Polaromonas naphthalenivorans CJ2]